MRMGTRVIGTRQELDSIPTQYLQLFVDYGDNKGSSREASDCEADWHCGQRQRGDELSAQEYTSARCVNSKRM